MRSEGGDKYVSSYLALNISTLSHGSEGADGTKYDISKLNISVLLHGCEGRPEEMICLKKVKIENGIWISVYFICRIVFYMCVLLLISQHFKTVRNQRKEALK